ncbi:hypothetical protein M514_05444 [Trichuris suis]|uniref:Cyclin C-terminal domain-containing protein n=1 Tax=Trichuris suis TaxID=68888 RepID=A0A085NSL2_9BILA|nr:hypothetical protein M513_05444 [Trichuris suis]KFD72458.1 hypothetical protein M514_05444 [Trichuris suis]KHJ39811.1 hypothetical protein D918_10160 [Trichuris suis]
MVTLTLARHILENSLLYCEFSVYLESELAAASLLLAVKLPDNQIAKVENLDLDQLMWGFSNWIHHVTVFEKDPCAA